MDSLNNYTIELGFLYDVGMTYKMVNISFMEISHYKAYSTTLIKVAEFYKQIVNLDTHRTIKGLVFSLNCNDKPIDEFYPFIDAISRENQFSDDIFKFQPILHEDRTLEVLIKIDDNRHNKDNVIRLFDKRA